MDATRQTLLPLAAAPAALLLGFIVGLQLDGDPSPIPSAAPAAGCDTPGRIPPALGSETTDPPDQPAQPGSFVRPRFAGEASPPRPKRCLARSFRSPTDAPLTDASKETLAPLPGASASPSAALPASIGVGLPRPSPNPLTPTSFHFERRWSRTATDPAPPIGPGALRLGDPITLTWSVVPDGTPIPGGGEGGGEPSGTSNLIAFLDGIYGQRSVWLALLEEVFARWDQVSGVRYVHEPRDDGAPFPASEGQLGARGDIRLAGHFIDGPSQQLAYSFFPDRGDMVFDTGDPFFLDTSHGSIRLRNVLAHEHGHQLGLRHLCPIDATKLMEPRFTTLLDGPQHTDILTVQRLYGDRFEPNDSAGEGVPTDLDPWQDGELTLGNLSIDDDADADVFRFSAGGEHFRLSALLRPLGGVREVGRPNADGSCGETEAEDSLSVHDLRLSLLGPNGTTLLHRADAHGAGETESIDGFLLPHGRGPYHLVVEGGAKDAAQLYELDLRLSDATVFPDVSILDVESGEDAGTVPVPVRLSSASQVEIVLRYAVRAGSAAAGDDFAAAEGAVIIPPGADGGEIEVSVVDDLIDEEDETIVITLRDARNAVLVDAEATLTIRDDDLPPLLEVAPISPFENADAVTLDARLSQPSGRPVSVRVTAVPGTAAAGLDYFLETQVLEFAPGTAEAQIGFAILEDSIDENNEWFALAFDETTHLRLPAQNPRVTIVDNDPPPAVSVEAAPISEAAGELSVEVILSHPSAFEAEIRITAASGTAVAGVDFTAVSHSLRFLPGETRQTAIIPLLDDLEVETDKKLLLTLDEPIRVVVDASAPFEATILDDEAPAAFPSTARLTITAGGGETTLRWLTVPGRTYTVEKSLEMRSWTALPDARQILSSDTVLEIEDTGGPAAYYRVLDDPVH